MIYDYVLLKTIPKTVLGKYADAITYFDKALAVDGNFTEALINKVIEKKFCEFENHLFCDCKNYEFTDLPYREEDRQQS